MILVQDAGARCRSGLLAQRTSPPSARRMTIALRARTAGGAVEATVRRGDDAEPSRRPPRTSPAPAASAAGPHRDGDGQRGRAVASDARRGDLTHVELRLPVHTSSISREGRRRVLLG